MIDSAKVLYSKGSNDECMTPAYGVTPIIKFIPQGVTVWCPFDKEDSEFVKQISEKNDVVHSHIDGGQDFYEYEPSTWDIIVSNPPYTRKRKIFERCIGFGKPFSLLMSNTWLNDAAPVQIFMDIDLQLLMFDKRIEYNNKKKITFKSSYYCRDLLPKQIVMETLIRD